MKKFLFSRQTFFNALTKQTLVLLFIFLAQFGFSAYAQDPYNLATWDMAGTGGASSVEAGGLHEHFASATAEVGPGLVATTYGQGDGLTGRSINSSDLEGALAADDYFSIVLTPNVGTTFSITDLNIRPVSQNNERTFTVFSSVEGFEAGKELFSFSMQNNSGHPVLEYPVAAHQDITEPVEFRMYVHGSPSEYGSAGIGIGDDIDLYIKGTSVSGDVYSLDVTSEHGSVTINPEGGVYLPGTEVTLTAEADFGYAFSNWSGGHTATDNPTIVTVSEDISVVANYTVVDYLTLSTTSLMYNKEASASNVAVTSNRDWNVAKDQPWITVFPASGNGDGQVTVSVEENNTGESRSGSITISGGEFSHEIPVTQRGPGLGDSEYPAAGIGMDGVSFYSAYSAFSDALKHARWIDAASWNENGFPSSANAGTEARARIGVDNGTTWPDGEYLLTWEGDGDVRLNRPGDATLISEDLSSETKRRVYDANVENYGLEVVIDAYPVDNIKLSLPGLENHHSIWNPSYIDYIKPLSGGVIRFMDLNGTNGSTQKDWNDRTPRNWSSYANSNTDNCAPWDVEGKASYESMIELCNEVGADMYICVPHLATDDYVDKLAHLIKTGVDKETGVKTTDPLHPDLKVWIEYSNEVWNWNFEQSNWVNDNIPGDGGFDGRYARQAAHIFDVFKAEWNDDKRLIRVLGTQTGWSEGWRTKNRLAAVDRSRYDVLAITSYFNPQIPGTNNNMQQWVYDNWGASEQAMIDEMMARMGEGPFKLEDTNENAVERYWHFKWAAEYDVPVITYEGGDHINAINKIDTSGDGSKDTRLDNAIPGSVDYIHRVMRHPDFHKVMEAWWQRHTDSGLITNIPFVLVGGWSEYGQWGMVEYVGQTVDEAQEYKALINLYELPYPEFNGVAGDQVAVTGISMITSDVPEMQVGTTYQLSASVSPSNATSKTITWESDNPAIASVSATGLVTAESKGSVAITATTEESSFTAQVTVNVVDEVTRSASITESPKLSVYPNPAINNKVNVYVSPDGNYTLRVYDINLREVIAPQTIHQSKVVYLEGLSGGVYIIAIETDSGITYEKIIK